MKRQTGLANNAHAPLPYPTQAWNLSGTMAFTLVGTSLSLLFLSFSLCSPTHSSLSLFPVYFLSPWLTHAVTAATRATHVTHVTRVTLVTMTAETDASATVTIAAPATATTQAVNGAVSENENVTADVSETVAMTATGETATVVAESPSARGSVRGRGTAAGDETGANATRETLGTNETTGTNETETATARACRCRRQHPSKTGLQL